jgi:hypothetical protein
MDLAWGSGSKILQDRARNRCHLSHTALSSDGGRPGIGNLGDLRPGGEVNYKGAYYLTRKAKLYTRPDKAISIYISILVPESAEFAGMHGDGLIYGGAWITWTEHFSAASLTQSSSSGHASPPPKFPFLYYFYNAASIILRIFLEESWTAGPARSAANASVSYL